MSVEGNNYKIDSSRVLAFSISFLSLMGVMGFMRFAFIPFKLMLALLIVFLALFLYVWIRKARTPFWASFPLYVYLIWMFVRSVAGLKYVSSSFYLSNYIMFVPATILVCSIQYLARKSIFVEIIHFWKVLLIPSLLFAAIMCKGPGIFGFLLCIIQIYLIWIKAFTYKTQFFILFLALLAIVGSFIFGDPVRASIVKYGVALLIGISCYFRRFIKQWMLKFAFIVCFIAPIYLLYSAATGGYSVFAAQEESNPNDLNTADTRTMLYVESITSAINNEYVIWGRTPARGYDSEYEKYHNDRPERSSEVSIINIFTWYGLIGVFLYTLLFWQVTKIGLNKSKNYYVQMLALYVAFRYTMAWIEDCNRFDIVNISLWMMMSICFLPSLRKLSNKKFKKAIQFMNF